MFTDALIRRILKYLESLLDEVSKISDELHEQVQANKKARSTDKAHQNSEPLAIKIVESIEAHKSASDKEKEADYQEKTLFWQRVTFFALSGYAILTLLIWIANKEAANAAKLAAETTYSQLFLAKRQGEEANQAAQKAMDSTVEQFRLDQRAWIGVTSIDSSEVKSDVKITIFLTLANTGKSPGIIDGGLGGCKLEVRSAPVPEDETYPSAKKRSRMVFFPNGFLTIVQRRAGEAEMSGATATVQATHFMTNGELDLIRLGKARLVAHGLINYIDEFQRRRFTKFCFQWDGDSPPTWGACPEHNDAD